MHFRMIRPRVAITLSLVWLAALAQAAQPVYQLRVDGLACPFCACGVEKRLGAIEGVQRIEVDIATGTVMVTLTAGAVFEEAAAKQAVKEAGFSLRRFRQAETAAPRAPEQETK